MFKKGQVLRHRLTGSAVLVIEWPRVRRLTKPTIGRAPVGREYCVSKHLEHYFNLIGNNYQERLTTKAEKPAMKQSHTLKLVLRGGSLRPDGRFWYSETTIKQIAAEAGIEVQS